MAVVVVLAGAVAIAKVGQGPTSTPGVSLSAAATPLVVRPTLTVARRPVLGIGSGLIGSAVGVRADGQRFDDGLPAQLYGQEVVRVREAGALPVGSALLVGGWMGTAADCPTPAVACPSIMSDLPYSSARVAKLVLQGQTGPVSSAAPRIIAAVVQTDPYCRLSVSTECLPQLFVSDIPWQGDEETGTDPVSILPLLGHLSLRFPDLDFHPFEEATSCPVRWPVQSYLASGPGTVADMRLVVLFSSVADRVAFEPDLRRASAGLTKFDAFNRCVAVPFGPDDRSWIVRDNAMVLLATDDPTVRAAVDAALLAAMPQH